MDRQDHYSILGIGRSASGAEIKWAYRRLAQRFHPDVTDDPDGERKFKAVGEAYRTLKLSETRAAYDRQVSCVYGDELAWLADPLAVWCALFAWPGWTWVAPQ